MSDIFNEIEQDLRRARYRSLGWRYGPWAAGFLVLALGGVGVFVFVSGEEDRRLEAQSLAFDGAVSETEGARLAALEEVMAGGEPYGTLAAFHAAALYAEKGEREKAVGLYDEISGSASVSPTLRALARIRAGYLLVEDAPLASLEERLGQEAADGAPFRFSAREILAYGAYRNSAFDKAREGFDRLISDENTPSSLRARARALVASLPPRRLTEKEDEE